MKAIAVGFSSAFTADLVRYIPAMVNCEVVDETPVLYAIDPSYSLYVFSYNSPVYDIVGRIFRANPASVVFQQLGEDRNEFIRISEDLEVSDDIIQRATEKVMKVKSLSTKLRHDVRSPIQSIFDSAEKLLKAKALEDREQLLSTLDVLHRNASRIYAAIESFSDFHRELDSLEEILLRRSFTDKKDEKR